MEENKPSLPVLLTPQAVQLNINLGLTKKKLSVADLQKTALELVMNEDHLKEIGEFLESAKKIKDEAEELFKEGKKPHWDAGKAWDNGKKLVFDTIDTIVGKRQEEYDKMLKAVAEKNRLAAQKKLQDQTILKGIEDNIIVFSNKIIAAVNLKQLREVESLINLQKSPSMAKKYGDFHAQACSRFDEVLIPIIRDQKTKVAKLKGLNEELLAAEASNDPEKMDELLGKVDEVSNEMLQNHADLQTKVLMQESFPVTIVEEVLPAVRTKRTNFTFEIDDVEVALKKSRSLLDITVNNDACREVLKKLKEEDAFADKDEVVRDGIKFIATKVRQVL